MNTSAAAYLGKKEERQYWLVLVQGVLLTRKDRGKKRKEKKPVKQMIHCLKREIPRQSNKR